MDYYSNLLSEWSQLKTRISFSAVLGYYRVLIKEHSSMALCPFHDDHNPSMHIDEQLGLYHCFSCNASGDIISFIRHKEQCDFTQAAQKACDICGIVCSLKPKELPSPKHNELYKINEKACCFFESSLLANQKVIEYLKKRNISLAQIQKHRLGYAPLIKNNKLPREDLMIYAKTDIVGKYGQFHLAHRVIFPIINTEGKVAGFGGRALEDNTIHKYINSKESPIFVKKHLAYNMQHLTLDKDKPIYLVEGYVDAIKLQELGYRVVALMGATLSKTLFKTLCLHSKHLIFALDYDSAGATATESFINQTILPSLTNQITVSVALYREKDPSDSADYSKFDHIIVPLATYCQFYIEKRQPRNTLAFNEFYSLSKKIPDNLARNTFYNSWERDIHKKDRLWEKIEHIKARAYLTEMSDCPYINYIRSFPSIIPQVIKKLRSHYSYAPLDEHLEDFYHNTFILANSKQTTKEDRTISPGKHDWCFEFLMNVVVQNCLQFLRAKNKENHSIEESTKLLEIMMELAKMTRKQ